LVLLREGEGASLKTLLLLRADRGDQNSRRWVFPGGLVDATDCAARMRYRAQRGEVSVQG
jgi:8-oxo-dGTP pyrophosphatase MutT (NUDIX family)